MTDLFVYGTLRSARLLAAVSGRDDLTSQDATVSGYTVGAVAGDVVPFVKADPDGACAGLLITNIPADAMTRLDTYEGAFGYDLIDVEVLTSHGARQAKLYVPPADIAMADHAWSLTDWCANWETLAVYAATELFRHDPPLSFDQIKAQWAGIQSRAWAKCIAQSGQHPTQLRRTGAPEDIDLTLPHPPTGGFFRFEDAQLRARQFSGQMSDTMSREGFVGFDAGLLLPYDPVRDRVLLVEQVRMGAVMREDPDPWLLEPVAGMIDPRESPQDCVLREGYEEAHLSNLTLHPVAKAYASPGASSDFFHMFVGVCDLPDTHPRYGGLDAEGEDIRLHLISRSAALDLIRSNEINVTPLMTLLFWLELNKASLGYSA